ncbi:MAG TPA: tetratricopeptide repeat protein, partial [Thermoanaerobaculia bacterium]|nr:tetratricopeptide repeat protein [Thermoanaerobaculia bacterium]
MHKPPDQYPVALAYASENEALVKAVYRHLRSRNINAFFAPTKTSYLWGKDEREFQRIYGPGSRYVVPFISEDYIRKEWPRLEFRAARKEARTRGDGSILPVRIDDSVLPGLPKRTQYVDARRYSPKQIAELLIEKLEADVRTTEQHSTSHGKDRHRVRIIGDEERELLGLLATAAYPLRAPSVQTLIPGTKWDTHLRRWRSCDYLVANEGRFLLLDPVLKRQLLGDKVAVQRWRERWVTLLNPLRAHTDMGLMLALELIALDRTSEAVEILASVAISLEPGIWNGLYLLTFEALASSPLLRRAGARARVEFHNAYGALLAQNGKHQEALVQFARLRELSRKTGNVWGEGQSYINAGVAATHSDDVPAAIAWYEQAAAFGKKHRDHVLAGRAIGNLANFVDPGTASELLAESERLKIRGGDVVGLAGTALVRGNVAALQGDFVGASKHYRHAIRLAKQLDLRHVHAIAMRNLARTEVDRGRPKKAYPAYQESARICRKEGFAADHAHAVAGEALARMNAREFARAGKLFETLAKL